MAGAMVAQEIPSGVVQRFDFTQRLEYSDNPDLRVDGESDFFGRTLLNYGLESVNSLERFTLGLGATVDIGRQDRDTVDLRDSNASLGYRRATRNAFVDTSFRYRLFDPSSTFFRDDFDQDGRVINQTEGDRQSFVFNLSGAVGQEAPIGASFGWSYSELNFNDTDDPELADRSDNRFSGQVDFRISPRITANLNGIYRDFSPERTATSVARETRGLGAGLDLQIDQITRADFLLRYDEIERSGAETGTDEGYTIGANLNRDRPNGTIGLSFLSEVSSNINGRRTFLTVDRDMDLPRGALSFALGVTGAGDIIGTDPLIDVNYRYDLPSAALTFGVSRRVVVTNENDEQINSRARFAYDQRINNLSSAGLIVSFLDRQELRVDPNDGQRIDIGLSYRYSLTRDWGLVAGYNYAYVTEDIDADRTRNTVFLGLQTNFTWFP